MNDKTLEWCQNAIKISFSLFERNHTDMKKNNFVGSQCQRFITYIYVFKLFEILYNVLFIYAARVENNDQCV